MQLNKKSHGLNLINLRCRDAAIKISWLCILDKDWKLANLAYYFLSPVLGEKIWMCNLSIQDVSCVIRKENNEFWHSVLSAWAKFNFCASTQHASQVIWYNSLIRIGGQPFFWDKCYNAGLMYVHQLYHDGMIIGKSKREVMCLSELDINMLLSAIPVEWRQDTRAGKKEVGNAPYLHIIQMKSPVKTLYKRFTASEETNRDKFSTWYSELGGEITHEEYNKAHKQLYVTSNVPKLHSFQYRLLQHAIVLNPHLYHCGIKPTKNCSFCNMYPETLRHIFLDCEAVQPLWKEAATFFGTFEWCDTTISFKNVVLNTISEKCGSVLNFLCLLLKQFIYAQRCLGRIPYISDFKQYVWKHENMERYIAGYRNKL